MNGARLDFHTVRLDLKTHDHKEDATCDVCKKVAEKCLIIYLKEGDGRSTDKGVWVCENCLEWILSVFKED